MNVKWGNLISTVIGLRFPAVAGFHFFYTDYVSLGAQMMFLIFPVSVTVEDLGEDIGKYIRISCT